MADEKDEILKRFLGDSLKDLKNLRKQLYSAADCFESSYKKHNHKQFVVDSSREYVTKALVSTVDHLGSAAHKLNKFLDEKLPTQFSATNMQLCLIQHRLSTIQGVPHNLLKIELPTNNHLLPAAFGSKPVDGNLVQQSETLFSVKKTATRKKPPFMRKEEEPRKASSSNPPTFSFTRMPPEKQPGRRAVSPLRFLSGSVIKRSISPTPSVNKGRNLWSSEARRAVSAGRRRDDDAGMKGREMEESYAKRSRHLFKALIGLHHSKKDSLST